MFSDGNIHILFWSWAGDLLFQVLVAIIQAGCPGLHLNDLVSSEILRVIFLDCFWRLSSVVLTCLIG